MSAPITVQIIGAPIACKEGIKDTWRETASWVSAQLHQRFGEVVEVKYFDLFDPACPLLPTNAQLPVVMINGQELSNGGKISVPAIRRRIELLLEKETAWSVKP
jgi:disulfide oxidoreductase YuzD